MGVRSPQSKKKHELKKHRVGGEKHLKGGENAQYAPWGKRAGGGAASNNITSRKGVKKGRVSGTQSAHEREIASRRRKRGEGQALVRAARAKDSKRA